MPDMHLERGPTISADNDGRTFARQLIEKLNLQFCSWMQNPHFVAIHGVPVGKSSLVSVDAGSECTFKARVGEATTVVWFTLRGAAQYNFDGKRVECSVGEGCVWPDSVDVRVSTTDDYSGLAIRIDQEAFARELARLLGRRPPVPLKFDVAHKIHREANNFGALVRFLCGSLDATRNLLSRSEMLSSGAEKLLVLTLLTTQPSNYSEALNALNDVAVPRHVHATMQAVRLNPERSWTLTELAAAGGVSVRTISQGFKTFCACTARQFVQVVRLARIRKELLIGSCVTIETLARDNGFHHPGRFAATYKRVYGETPSATAQRVNQDNGTRH